ncbi:MAG: hypothetical protein Q9M20_04470 [Mariprofundaceae bacterium]|nr:hypothetical protein [Mariprofundaceae bacterium]
MTSQQQRLLFTLPVTPGYHTWVHHQGTADACTKLLIWLKSGGILWLKSDVPAGKSHLLRALFEEYPKMGSVKFQVEQAALEQIAAWLERLEQYSYWSIDLPAGQLPRETAMALFHLIERAKIMGRPLLIVWRCFDNALHPAELASRMRMMERACIHPPESDDDLRCVLKAAAQQLCWDIPDQFLKVMLMHLPRDLDTQLSALHYLEAASQTERSRMTQAWARQKLNV